MKFITHIAGIRVEIHRQNGPDSLSNNLWTLQAQDEGGGTITLDDYLARIRGIDAEISTFPGAMPVLDTDEYRASIVAHLRKQASLTAWCKNVASILIPKGTGVAGQVFVRMERVAQDACEVVKCLPRTTFNTLDYPQLFEAFQRVVAKHGAQVDRGLGEQYPDCEDGLAWFEVLMPGRLSEARAKALVRDFAREMNVRVFFNRVHGRSGSWLVVGAFDFDTQAVDQVPVPPYARDGDATEFLAEYGAEYAPPKRRTTR